MYAKVYQYKFPGISEAKVAAAYCSDKLGQKIDEHNFHGLGILISQEGDLTILIKFDDVTKLKSFDKINIIQKSDDKNSSWSRHSGPWSDLVLHESQEGKEFHVKINDFGTTFGAHFLLTEIGKRGKRFFGMA